MIVASYLKLLAPAKVFCLYLMLTPGWSFKECLSLEKKKKKDFCIILKHGGKWTGFLLDACYCLHLIFFSHALYHLWFQCSGQMSSWLHRWINTLRQCLLNRTHFYEIFETSLQLYEQNRRQKRVQHRKMSYNVKYILYSESLKNFIF